MSRHSILIVCVFFAAGFLAVTNSVSCHRGAPARQAKEQANELAALAMLPADTGIVVALDLDRLRGQPVWKTLSPILAKHAGGVLDEIAAGTGVDPTRQVHRLWVGLPSEPQSDGRFVLLAETDAVDTIRAALWLKSRAGGWLSVLPVNSNQIVISKGEWAREVAAHLPRSAADNPELHRLCQRSAGEHSAWFAAVVPTSLRRRLMEAGPFPDVASLTRGFGFFNDAAGLHAELVGEFGNTKDPAEVAHRLEVLHNQAKRAPELLVAGLSPYLQALRVEARDARIRIALDLADRQAADVIEAIEALARTTRTK